MSALESLLWTLTQGDVEMSLAMDYTQSGERGGDVMPPMFEVALESLVPHSMSQNYLQLEYSMFQVPVEGE